MNWGGAADADATGGASESDASLIPFGKDSEGNDISYGQHILDALVERGVQVEAVFCPEHGFRGTQDAGAEVENDVDEETGVPVVSLYGSGKRGPDPDDLDWFDVLVVDIQEVGLRYYTYYISMYRLMDACAAAGKEVLILDRPRISGICGRSICIRRPAFSRTRWFLWEGGPRILLRFMEVLILKTWMDLSFLLLLRASAAHPIRPLRGRLWRAFSLLPPRKGKFLDFVGRFWRKFSLLPPRMGDFLDYGGRFRRGIFVVAPTDGKNLRFRGAACSGTCFSLPHENVKASSSWGGFFRHFLRPPHGS